MTVDLKFLVDTNVLSELSRKLPYHGVLDFFSENELASVSISAMTVGELRKGVAKKAKSDWHAALVFERWVDELEVKYSGRVLPVDSIIASIWGPLSLQRTRPVVDTLIAATAMHHGLTLVTRNTHDFADTGVLLLNPWQPN